MRKKAKNNKASWYSIKAAANNQPAEVLLYDEIGFWGVTAADFIADFNAINDSNITLRINSPGGSVFEGMAIYNAIRRHKATITTQIDGIAASMASIIALAGDYIKMSETAYYMIHNPFGFSMGTAKDLRKDAQLLDEMADQMVNIYQSKSTLSREEIIAAMDDETWYTGPTALTAGFVSELTETLDAAACYHGTDAVNHFTKSPITITQANAQEDPPQPPKLTHLIAAKHDLLRLQDDI